jgi:outer membrane protein assembly factor BamB
MTRKRIAKNSSRGWKTKLPGVEFAILPASTTRPNPLVVGDKVFVSIFSPGAVCGLAKRTGKLLWRTPLDAFGGSDVILANGTLLAKSCRTLYALNPETGEIRWEFTPQTQPGEWIYSQPAVGKRRAFIGDRAGRFYCVDAITGEPIWRRLTSRDSNNQVNATALIAGPHVITANNAGAVICYAASTGETIWRQRVGGPCTLELLRLGSNVVVGANSLYGLDVRTGAVRLEIGFSQKDVSAVTVAKKNIVAVFGPDSRVIDQDGLRGYELVVVERGSEIARRAVKGIGHVRTCADTGLVFCVDGWSMDALDPSTGSLVLSLRKRMALPDRSRGVLYGLTDSGVVFSERSVSR